MGDQDPSSGGWTAIFLGLPPQLQGVFVVIVALVVGYFVWSKFLRQLRGDAPQATEYAVGEPTTFADMSPVRTLTREVVALCSQMAKGEEAELRIADALERRIENDARVAEALERLCLLMADFLKDTRDRQQLEDLRVSREEGYQDALRTKRSGAARRRTPKPNGGG